MAFDYSLPINSVASITVTDATGKTVDRFDIKGERGQYVWDTRKVKSGIYFYTLYVDGKTKSGKIVINK
ncbi:MAG: T9SS type A sorting domain-containing protein [Chlorobi bacterium]|nr:T9SS type A sorting domain-containing protein [Chlorobiota bacterium]